MLAFLIKLRFIVLHHLDVYCIMVHVVSRDNAEVITLRSIIVIIIAFLFILTTRLTSLGLILERLHAASLSS